MLEQLLKPSTCQANVNVGDWKEAGRKAGRLLLNKKLITENYIESMINGVYEYGPYIVIGPGIALFHARPEEGVNDICLSMVTLEQPVEFGAGENDPVDLIFVLGAVDHNSHLNLMAELMQVLQDGDLLSKIRSKDNANEILELIHSKLRKKEK